MLKKYADTCPASLNSQLFYLKLHWPKVKLSGRYAERSKRYLSELIHLLMIPRVCLFPVSIVSLSIATAWHPEKSRIQTDSDAAYRSVSQKLEEG